jgi:DNA polymerase III alpha subunit
MPDIDIDFVDRQEALDCFKHITASREDDDKLVKHNTGVYFHEVPVHAPTNLCAVSYKEAEEQGYFKVDFLNINLYDGIKNEEHLVELMNKEPLWSLLEQKEFVDMLFHVNGHDDILKQMKPDSVEKLAAVLAVIRPAKRHLIGKHWDTVLESVWKKPNDDSYYFKKSHATAYAMAIVVQMNLICERLSSASEQA